MERLSRGVPSRGVPVIDWIVYLVVTVVAGGLLSFAIALFKVGPGRPDFPFAKVAAGCLALTTAGPFLFVEAQTRLRRDALAPAVRAWYARSDDITGALVGMKVLLCTPTRATVLVIGREPAMWGDDRPIVRLTLVRKAGAAWSVGDAQVLRSGRLDKDEFVMPPYQ